MLSVIFLVVEFLALALMLRRVTGASLAVTPVAISSLVIVLLFFGEYAVGIRPVSVMIHLAGAAASLWLAFGLLRQIRRDGLRATAAASGGLLGAVLFATVLAVALYQLDRLGAYRAWDEFSHWGTIIRAISENASFRFNPNPLYFQDYPPGAALFAFHILLLTGYSEGSAFFSYAFLVGVFAIPVVVPAFRLGVACGGLAVGAVFLLFFAFGTGWSTVLIDHVLAAMFAGTVAVVLQSPPRRGNFFVVPLALAALALVKHSGVTLGLLAAVICVAWRLVPALQLSRPFFLPNQALGSGRRVVLWSVTCLAAPVLISLAWNAQVTVSGSATSLGSKSVVTLAAKSFTCCKTEREIQVARNFFATLFDAAVPPQASQPVSLPRAAAEPMVSTKLTTLLFRSREYAPPKVWLSLMLIGFLFAASQRDAVTRKQTFICSMLLTLGAVGYCGALLSYYLYAFSDYEASTLISFTRYQNVFLLGWALIVVALWGRSAEGAAGPNWERALVALVPIWGLWGLGPYIPLAWEYLATGAPGMTEQRRPVRDWASAVAAIVPRADSVFIVWQGSDGREFWQAKHELLPRVTNKACFSLGDPQRKDDTETCGWDTTARLKTELAGFDFFAIGSGYRYLAAYYGDVLKDGPPDLDQALFKIDRVDGDIRLSNVTLPLTQGSVQNQR